MLLSGACCREESEETARYELTETEQALIPYEYGETINCKHSNGYSFDFSVIENTVEWEEYYDFCEWFCCGNDYYSYQVKKTVLESDYPRLHIELLLGETNYEDYSPRTFSVELNNNFTAGFSYDKQVSFICDSLTNTIFYDTIIVNDQQYFDVVLQEFDCYNDSVDSTELIPMYLLYNSDGLLQIKMTNDETYTFNN